MSASKETPDPFAEWRGVDPWASVEPSKVEYPDPLDPIGLSVVCPGCEMRMSKNGYPSHYRRDHAGRPR